MFDLILMWLVVAGLAIAGMYWMPAGGWVRTTLLASAVAVEAALLAFVAWLLLSYQEAREGLLLALAIAAVVGAIMYPLARGWRPGLPRLSMPRMPRLPVRAVWPQGRYRTQYAADTEIWTVEDFER